MFNILIITVGATPQIVTETVWALLTRDPPFVPGRILLVTTARGREELVPALCGPQGRLSELFVSTGNTFVEPEILLPKNSEGSEMGDIRTEDENAAYANSISGLIRQLTDDPETKLHVSLAGGRKTMSYYAGMAISLFGRDQDELSHVLVDPEIIETSKTFWWPDQNDQDLGLSDHIPPLSARSANISMPIIPFVRLSQILPRADISESDLDYTRIIQSVQESLEGYMVRLKLDQRTISIGKHEVRLPHRLFALYRLLAVALTLQWMGAGPDGEGNAHRGWVSYSQLMDPNSDMFDRFLEYYSETFAKGQKEVEEFEKLVRNKRDAGLTGEARKPFTEALSRLNSQLRNQIDNPAIRHRIQVVSSDDRPVRFGLMLEPHQIEFD